MDLDALSLLETCEEDIELNCSLSINVDEEQCNIIAKTFVEKYDTCNGKSLPQDKCNCIKDLAPDYEAVKKCRKRTTDVFSTSIQYYFHKRFKNQQLRVPGFATFFSPDP